MTISPTPTVLLNLFRSSSIFALALLSPALTAYGSSGPDACLPRPPGLVAWWTGDGTGNDAVGTNHALLRNGAGYAPGLVGQGFSFDGANDFVLVPDSATLDLSQGVTMELWFKADDYAVGRPLFDKRAGGASCNYGTILDSGYGIELYYNDPAVADGDYPGSGFEIATARPLPTAGVFHHFAGTYRQADSNHIELNAYVNGVLVRSATFLGSLARTMNAAPLSIGAEGAGSGAVFKGVIDEVSLYNRALSPAEVTAMYAAGSAGKCRAASPPVIVAQPQSQAVAAGGAVTLTVEATGTAPLSYQWLFNGGALAGATRPLLVLSNVQPGQAGDYAAVIANAAGA